MADDDLELKWDLEENAEGFLREAVKYVESGKGRDWVFAVTALATALELCLKAILRKEHWSLLFEDVGTASEDALRSGKFKSVGFQEALRRCQEIARVDLEEKDLRYIRHVQELRNQVLHYEFALNVEQIKGVIARALNIFNHLYTKNLKRGGGLGSEISVRLLEFRKYVDERMRRLEPRLKKAKRPWVRECPACSQSALILGKSGEPTCIFCGADTTARKLAKRYESDEGECPECESGRIAFVLLNNDEGISVCVLCGYRQEGRPISCTECGEKFWTDESEEDVIELCPDCFDYKLNKD